MHAQKDMKTEVLNDRTTLVTHDHFETVKNNQTVTIAEGFHLTDVQKSDHMTTVRKGSLMEDVFKLRGTTAGSVEVRAVDNGGSNDGMQSYQAAKQISLSVEESKIALTPDGIQLQVGNTFIQLTKDGITINGEAVFINC